MIVKEAVAVVWVDACCVIDKEAAAVVWADACCVMDKEAVAVDACVLHAARLCLGFAVGWVSTLFVLPVCRAGATCTCQSPTVAQRRRRKTHNGHDAVPTMRRLCQCEPLTLLGLYCMEHVCHTDLMSCRSNENVCKMAIVPS